jgi:uncharacterized RDD family membrane protein YckC
VQWHYARDGQSVGPIEEGEFRRLIESGAVSADTLVWHEGMSDWKPCGQVDEARTAAPAAEIAAPAAAAEPAAPLRVCSVCGGSFGADDLIEYDGATVCAACKPGFFQRVKEGAALPGVMAYAGFWIRFAAKLVDGIILSAASMVVSLVAAAAGFAAQSAGSAAAAVGIQVALGVIQMAVGVAYTGFFLGRFGATPGKMACRLRVVRADGSALSYGRGFGRYFAEILSSLILNIGYLMAAFDDERRALHDRICDTRVIKIG